MALRQLRKNKAFSLLELIIAVTILSTGIVFILQAISFSARVTGLSCDIISAVFLAEDKIQGLELKERQNLLKAETAKDTKDKFSWEYDLSLDEGLKLYKLNFDVTWQRANRQERLEIDTYLK